MTALARLAPALGPRLRGAAARGARARPDAGGAAAFGPSPLASLLVRAGAATGALVGLAYLALWLAGLPPRWAFQGVIVMKTNMALAQVLAGAALLLLLRVGAGRRGRDALGRVAAALVLLIGALTLAEYLLGIDLGIDQLLATEPPEIRQTLSPNRMGLPGATCLTLLGAGLLALAARRRAFILAGAATCGVALVPAVGFLYGVAPLYDRPQVTAIAWPTVVALLALGLGLALSQPRDGSVPVLWRDDAGGMLFRRLLLPVALLPVAIGYLRLVGERHGLYDRHVGTGLFAVSLSVLSVVLLWRGAARVSQSAVARARAEDEARWRAGLLELAQDAILVWSPERGIESWNHGAAELYGYPAEEALGRVSHELLGTVFPRPWPEIQAELERQGHWSGELTHRTREGGEVIVSTRLQLVRGADGGVRVLESNRDVTEERRAERELRASEERLREADRRKDEFLGMLSHELRNPLAPIRNALFILERAEPAGPQARRAREVAGRQVKHLARLVDDLLDVTRVARGKIELRLAEVDLAALVRRTADDHQALFTGRGLALELELPDAPVRVRGDETRLAQVLGNLLHNALKFTPAGGRVTVALEVAEGAARLRVRDTGAGVEAALLDVLFEPFTQARQTLARSEGGLGLGLALVKALAELHGGSVAAASGGPGRGSEFTVRLPL